MANFPPLKNYIIYCLSRLIKEHNLISPFLDIGCGIGDISSFLAALGWQGKAIDFSEVAVQKARENLAGYRNIQVQKQSIFEETGSYNSIFLMDVLEHIADDKAALNKISSILSADGYLVVSVPSNPGEWRWDDEFYGHYRRYTQQDIKQRLTQSGLYPIVIWDFTYPFFWLMRRVYTRLKSASVENDKSKLARTMNSTSVNAWDMPFFSRLLSRQSIFWGLIYKVQFSCFKERVHKGHEMLILAKKGMR